MYRVYALIAGIFLVILDQCSKYYVESLGIELQLLPFLDIVQVRNYGIAFGLLSISSGYTTFLLGIFSFGASIYIFFLLRQYKNYPLGYISLVFILSGAIGNGINRLIDQYVFDFIHLHYNSYSFPVFNVADCAITLGIVLWLISEAVCRLKSN